MVGRQVAPYGGSSSSSASSSSGWSGFSSSGGASSTGSNCSGGAANAPAPVVQRRKLKLKAELDIAVHHALALRAETTAGAFDTGFDTVHRYRLTAVGPPTLPRGTGSGVAHWPRPRARSLLHLHARRVDLNSAKREKETLPRTCIRRHQAFALAPVCAVSLAIVRGGGSPNARQRPYGRTRATRGSHRRSELVRATHEQERGERREEGGERREETARRREETGRRSERGETGVEV